MPAAPTPKTPRRPIRLGVSLLLIVPAAVAVVILQESGVSRLGIAGGLALVPIAAVLIPAIRRRWADWGPSVCMACAIMAAGQAMRGRGVTVLGVLATGLAGGGLALAMTYVTGVLARIRSTAQ